MDKIKNISYKFSLIFKILLIIYPCIQASIWLGFLPTMNGYFSGLHLPIPVNLEALRFQWRLLGFLVALVPTSIIMFGFYYLIKLFQLYVKGVVFAQQNIYYIRKIALMFLLQVVATIVIQPFLSLILTLDAAPGGHIISIGLRGEEISNLIIAGIVFLIAWIMEEARKLDEERALTV